jgi:nucleoside-diphosphate-sugar epimerase
MNVLVSGGANGLGAAVVEAVKKAGGRPYVLDRVPVDGVPHAVVDLADTRAAEKAALELAILSGAWTAW